MKMNHNLAAALISMFNAGFRRPRSITDGNRIHTDRARPGSVEALERIAAADAKRARKMAKRAGK